MDGSCSRASKQAVDEHLADCPKCRGALMKLGGNDNDATLVDNVKDFFDSNSQTIKSRAHILAGSIAALLIVALVVCFVCNLVLDSRLDWFYIVLTSAILFASLTIVPLMMPLGKKLFWTIISGSLSLLLMLYSISTLSNGKWLVVTVVSLVFGLSVIFLPYLLSRLPLGGFAAKHKGLISMLVDTILLYILIFTTGGNVLIATVSAVYPWLLFLIIRYLKTNGFVKAGLCIALTGLFAAGLSDVINLILYGGFQLSLLNANLMNWSSDALINANAYLLSAIGGLILGAIFVCVGLVSRKKVNK